MYSLRIKGDSMVWSSRRIAFLVVPLLLSIVGFALWASQRQAANGNWVSLDQSQKPAVEGTPSQEIQAASPPSRGKTVSATTNSNPQENIPPSDEVGDVQPLTTQQVFKLSARIVFAKCRNVTVRKEAGGNIFTFSEFDVISVIKGPNDTEFSLRLLGGRIGDTEISSSNIPSFKVGEEVVLFLGRDNKDGYPTVFPQGVFRVRTNPASNQRVVLPRPNGLQLFNSQDDKPYSTPPDPLPLQDFLVSLRKLK
jgi:hypothetical protein